MVKESFIEKVKTDVLVCKKEGIKCSNITKQYKNV